MRICLCGEAFGSEEEKVGKPFVGRSGQYLDRLLGASGIDRSGCFVTNVANERPPENDFSVYYQDRARKNPTDRLLEFWSRLRREVSDWRPDVVIPLGNEAMRALTGKRGIESWRGSVLRGLDELSETKIIPTFHPAALLRAAGKSAWYPAAVLHDFDRAKKEINQPFPEMPKVYVTTNPTDLNVFLEESKGKRVAVDIETFYKYQGEQVASIAFSSDPSCAIVIPFCREEEYEEIPDGKRKARKKYRPVQVMNTDTLIQFQGLIYGFFRDPTWLKVGQNIQYDINVLRRVGWIKDFDGVYMDTLIAHSNCVEPEFPHDLGFLSSWYTRVPYYKHMIKLMNEEFWNYNGYDAAVTLAVSHGIEQDMTRYKTDGFYHGYINNLIPCLADMNLNGLKVDKVYQTDLKARYKHEIELEKANLDRLTGEAIENHRSPKQVGDYLYGECKFNPVTKDGKVTTDELALKKLFKKYKDPSLRSLLKLRELEKMLGTYVNVDTNESDCVTTSYLFAKTGRFRSGGNDE